MAEIMVLRHTIENPTIQNLIQLQVTELKLINIYNRTDGSKVIEKINLEKRGKECPE